jgi:hypothetical protein
MFQKMWFVLHHIIPDNAFNERRELAEVELCEGLVEIRGSDCNYSIKKINIPATLRRIKDWAFLASFGTPIRLTDGIESIGRYAFFCCIFTNFRVPPLITMITNTMLRL